MNARPLGDDHREWRQHRQPRARLIELAKLISIADQVVGDQMFNRGAEPDPVDVRRLVDLRAEFNLVATDLGCHTSEQSWGVYPRYDDESGGVLWVFDNGRDHTYEDHMAFNLATFIVDASWYREGTAPKLGRPCKEACIIAYLGITMALTGESTRKVEARMPGLKIDSRTLSKRMGESFTGEVLLSMLHESARGAGGLSHQFAPEFGISPGEVSERAAPMAGRMLARNTIARQNEALCHAIARNIRVIAKRVNPRGPQPI